MEEIFTKRLGQVDPKNVGRLLGSHINLAQALNSENFQEIIFIFNPRISRSR